MLLSRLSVTIFLLAGISFGQGYGSIGGTVTDESGMAISGATVYALSIGRPTATDIPTAETDAERHYIFKRLDYGRFAVAPAKPADGYPTPWHVPNCTHMKYPEVELSHENQGACGGPDCSKVGNDLFDFRIANWTVYFPGRVRS